MTQQTEETTLSSGVPALDEIICGGFAPGRFYLIEGDTGAGKTTLALQFLLAGVKAGDSCMLITLSESTAELRSSAASHGWSLDGIHIVELIASEESLTPDARYTMFHPSEVELAQSTRTVLEEARKQKPKRIVVDSISELRLMAESTLRYRRQVAALKQHFARQQATVLVVDDSVHAESDTYLHSLAHGVIQLDIVPVDYGRPRRRLFVRKLRGCSFREGYHDLAIRRGGLTIFPRLVASEHRSLYERATVKSGIGQLDALLGGGLAKGTNTLVVGPAGSGKSTIAAQYVVSAAQRGERAAFFLFDEAIATLLERSSGLQMPVGELIQNDHVMLRQIDPAELSPGEFTHAVREAVEEFGAGMIVIDSLAGYLNAMPSERHLTLHLHELLTYLGQRGVTTIMLVTEHGLVGADGGAAIDTSYLADTVILLRYFETVGAVRQAVSVIKKRTGKHERTIRELVFDGGLKITEPLRGFQGVLSGVPQFVNNMTHVAGSTDVSG